MARLTLTTKVSRVSQPYPDANICTANDINAIRDSVNALYDLMAQMRQPLVFFLTSGSFSGRNYTDAVNLINSLTNIPLIAGKDFQLYTNGGSGTLLAPDDGYTFNATTGTITTDPGPYVLIIFKQLST